MVAQQSRNVGEVTLSSPEPPATEDSHPCDYYYRRGMPWRPAPPRAVVKDMWDQGRKELAILGRRFNSVPADTELTRLFADQMWQGDEPMDAVAQCFRRIGSQRGREMLDQALDYGINTVPDAPA